MYTYTNYNKQVKPKIFGFCYLRFIFFFFDGHVSYCYLLPSSNRYTEMMFPVAHKSHFLTRLIFVTKLDKDVCTQCVQCVYYTHIQNVSII